MTLLTRASNYQSISLGRQIASSGEGEVWETNESGYLAKIYHNPTRERIRKLAEMLANPPADPMERLNHISIAWPQDLLKGRGGDYVGFLMPAIRHSRELPSIYNPRLRKRNAPGFNWYYLHAAALNTAWIIQAIHAKGYVLGDIKPQNILVNERALVAVIDTDSFQVRDSHTGEVYRCTVGSEGFTPVELLGKDFSTTDQTEVHDRFRLAVLIHYLLFGYHPSSGQWIGDGESPEPTELIRRGCWPYGQNSLIRASQNTIPLDVVHPELKRCFLRCFNDGHAAPHLRPTAEEWHNALQVAINELTVCGKVDSHHYSQNYGKCYWCGRKALLGVDIFPGGSGTAKVPTATGYSKVAAADKTVKLLQGHFNSVNSVAFSPDGQTLASGGWDKTIKLWNLNTAQERTLKGHSGYVSSVTFSPDGQTLASGGWDKTIKVWNLNTGEELHTLQGNFNSINSVAFSPNGQTLASGSNDKTIKVWNLNTGQERTLKGHFKSVNSVAFSPDGQTLATGSWDKTIKVWNLNTGQELRTLKGHSDYVNSVAFSPDGQTLASGSWDKTIKVWNLNTGQELHTLQGHFNSINSVAFSPNGQTLASASNDQTIKVWNLNTGQELRTLKGHSDYVSSVAFSPDGQTLASGSGNGIIKIWGVPRYPQQSLLQAQPSSSTPSSTAVKTTTTTSTATQTVPHSTPSRQTSKQSTSQSSGNVQRKGVGWNFLFQWVLANSIVWAVVCGLLSLSLSIDKPFFVLLWTIFTLFFGLIFGSTQWSVLRQQVSEAAMWVIVSTVGWGASFATSLLVLLIIVQFSPIYSTANFVSILVFPLVGAIIGAAQLIVLQQWVSRAKWWVLVSTVSWTICFVASVTGHCIIGGVLFSLITGIALDWLLRHNAIQKSS